MKSTKLERSRMMGNYQVRFRSRVGRGDFPHLDNSNELIEIDAENMIRKINGVDQMALLQTVLGI